ncbi:MAG: GNAT family N-acetyltransferase [Candidatus Eremiobacteraeota bacterium]|nr:GNAT family N-acetyltransferase [Candidatus Eremiobacteraeota bacterium]
MQVERIEDLAELDRVRDDWERLYDADPNSQVFMSWAWTRALLTVTKQRWFILAVRDEHGDYVAFLPLAIRAFPSWAPAVDSDLLLAGNPMADLNGLLARPDCEAAAVSALTEHVRKMRWGTFHATDVSDPRLIQLFQSLPTDDFRPISFVKKDESPCPFVRLPKSWDDYLHTVSKRFRYELRKSIREVSSLPDFRMENGNAENIERHIDLCIEMSEVRWRNSRRYREQQRALMRECFRTGCLWSLTLWSGEEAVASILALLDGRGRVFSGYKIGFNPRFAETAPGKAIMGFGIQFAIAQNFTTYDFLRGGESYKLRFGSDVRFTRHFGITRSGRKHAVLNGARRAAFFAERALARTQRVLAK